MTTPLARCGTKGVGNKHGQDAFAGLSLSTIVPTTSPQEPARPITERMMNTLPTSYGPRLAFASAPLHFPIDPAVALTRAALLERLADLHQNEGCGWHADRLSHQVLELRCRATGERA